MKGHLIFPEYIFQGFIKHTVYKMSGSNIIVMPCEFLLNDSEITALSFNLNVLRFYFTQSITNKTAQISYV